MDERQEQINILAERIKALLFPIDLFIETLTDDETELIDECIESLEDKISHNESALPVIMALGGNYDSFEDRMKLQTVRTLKKLIDTRLEYKREVHGKAKQREQNMQILRAMGIM